jgi:hypothetical protein
MKDAKWENWLILLCGICVFSIPWTLSFGFGANDINLVMWNFLMIGGCVAVTSIIALRHLRVWTEWLSLFMGVWLIFSPLFLLYYKYQLLLGVSVVFGVVIAGLSALAIPIAEKKRVYIRMMRRQRMAQRTHQPIQH